MAQMNADEEMDARDPETYQLIGAAMTVHGKLGHGFLEAVYQEALSIELTKRGISFQQEQRLPIQYDGVALATSYIADFVCFNSVIVELKAIKNLEDAHMAQVINYLKATGMHRGILLNFGAPRLQYKRIVRELHLR